MTEARTAATTVEWASAHLPVVVGVDGSEGSRSALAWAADEAGRAGADLRVAIAAGYHRRFGHGRQQAERTVAAMAAEVTGLVPVEQVSHVVYDGPPETALLEHLDDARMLVIGKRGLGTLGRLFVGSVSLAVAGRSPVPVTVVPTGWDQAARHDAPLVVGVEPDQPHHHLLHLAFHRAERLGVPLVAMHGWEAPSAEPTDGATIGGEAEAHARFEETVSTWRERFPDVDVRTRTSSRHPALAVLEEAEAAGAQLVLLGRHHSNRFAGFGFGSVTRAVLHYTEVPVLVVPTDADEA